MLFVNHLDIDNMKSKKSINNSKKNVVKGSRKATILSRLRDKGRITKTRQQGCCENCFK
jgi:hypothetical protein